MQKCLWLLAIVVLTVGCQYDPFAHEFTHVKPSESELVGTYSLDLNQAKNRSLEG